MKKTYLNPKMRVVNLTESDAILMDLSNTHATGQESRRDRWQDDWDDEN